MGNSIGIRELKNRLSEVIRRIREGETMTITDRGHPVAVLMPIEDKSQDEILRMLVKTGKIAWSGEQGNPAGCPGGPRFDDSPASDCVVEDRR
jgi:prevent-host-death family protein